MLIKKLCCLKLVHAPCVAFFVIRRSTEDFLWPPRRINPTICFENLCKAFSNPFHQLSVAKCILHFLFSFLIIFFVGPLSCQKNRRYFHSLRQDSSLKSNYIYLQRVRKKVAHFCLVIKLSKFLSTPYLHFLSVRVTLQLSLKVYK